MWLACDLPHWTVPPQAPVERDPRIHPRDTLKSGFFENVCFSQFSSNSLYQADKNLMLMFLIWFLIWFLREPFLYENCAMKRDLRVKNPQPLHFKCTSACSKLHQWNLEHRFASGRWSISEHWVFESIAKHSAAQFPYGIWLRVVGFFWILV